MGGTRVTLQLKEDAHDYLSEDKLKESAKKYSQFIQFPIYVKVKKEVDVEAEETDDDDDDEEKEDEKKDDVEAKDEEEKEEKKDAPTKKTVYEWEQVNTQKAIWTPWHTRTSMPRARLSSNRFCSCPRKLLST